MSKSEDPLLCARCGVELTPGKGDFYVVKIEAWADVDSPGTIATSTPGSWGRRGTPPLSKLAYPH